MLKSTGYFRGVECPFREGCRRPHCHFRHRGRGLWSSEATEARNGAEYDPYTPDLPPIPPRLDENNFQVNSESCQDILELERVNKAIEEVKNEVEKEQRKYEELLETQKEYSSTLEKSATSGSFSPLEYDPGGSEYNPTVVNPSKYTFDDLESRNIKSGVMEYIPTVMTKYSAKKYVIDHSKPTTDMEYDPMSNYSARLLNKAKYQKATKRSRGVAHDKEYAPCFKKSCSQTSDRLVEATFSDSEEDSLATVNERVLTSTKDKSMRTLKETAVQYNLGDVNLRKKFQSKDPKKKGTFGDHKIERNESVMESSLLQKHSHKSKVLSKEQKKEKSKNKTPLPELKNKKKLVEADMKTKKESVFSKKNSVQISSKILAVNELLATRKEKQSKTKKEKKNRIAKESKQGVGDVNGKKHKVKNLKSESFEKCKEPTEVILKTRTKQRTLSHVDLFGDESSEEETEVKSKKCNTSSDRNSNSIKRTKEGYHRSSVSSVDSSELDYSILEQELDSDPDPLEECLRVFNESQDVKTEDKGRKGKQTDRDEPGRPEQNVTPLLPFQKKRISHISQSNHQADLTSKPVVRPYRRPTPQEICYQRFQKAQEEATRLLSETIQLPSSSGKAPLGLPGEKKRIAHVPGSQLSSIVQSQLPAEGKSPSLAQGSSSSSLKIRTLTGMTSKTTSTVVQKRLAHMPSLESAALKRPVIPTEYGAKVPTTVRQRYLNFFIDECLKFCHTQQEAFDKALEEEKAVYMRSNSRNIYLNVAVNTLKKLRSQGSTSKFTSQSKNVTNKKAVSHKSVLDGKLAAKTSFSVHQSTHQEEELTDVTLYKKLKNYILTPEQLKEHGYPFPHPDSPGKAMVLTEEKKSPSSSCRICCRCGVEYMVTQTGSCVRKEECIHHWGRLRRHRVPGGWETQYNCCSGGVGSPGCQVAKQHVHDGRKENLDGFVKTFEKQHNSESPGIFALDCEMCYTTKGLELTRVTVVNAQMKVVYDTFVQPDNKIVDYNTRFSGVTEEDLENTSITLRDVQAVLLSMFGCDTLLIGHSLESDLFALKLIHPTVIDTAVVFPHRLGLPYKRALRSLMADHLKRIIQDSVEGHDSSEDACSCMELMIWRIKEDAKVKR